MGECSSGIWRNCSKNTSKSYIDGLVLFFMVKEVVGFVERDVAKKKEVEEKVVLRGIENEFQRMLTVLQVEKKKLTQNLRLEKKIKRELVKIHKRILNLGKLIDQRSAVVARVKAQSRDRPKEALKAIEEVEKIDSRVGSLFNEISRDLNQHTLQEIAELYSGVNLSREEIAAIRDLALTLGEHLSQVMGPINLQEMEHIRRNIYYQNPQLR